MAYQTMAIATTDRPERCHGELRGPVLWGETMSARSASAGDPGLFVCATTTKAYDTEANQVLVAAFMRLYRAAGAAEHEIEEGEHHPRPEDVAHARHNGEAVRRALEHRSLHSVSRVKPIAFGLAPATAVVLGILFLGEGVSVAKIAGLVLVVAGVVLLTSG